MVCKNKALAKLKEELQNKIHRLMQILSKQSIELEMLQMKSQGQLDKIKLLNKKFIKECKTFCSKQ